MLSEGKGLRGDHKASGGQRTDIYNDDVLAADAWHCPSHCPIHTKAIPWLPPRWGTPSGAIGQALEQDCYPSLSNHACALPMGIRLTSDGAEADKGAGEE